MQEVITPSYDLISTETQQTGIFNQINNYSAPVLEKVNHVKEDYEQKVSDYLQQLMQYKNQAIEKGTQYKNMAVEKGLYYKEQALEKSSQYKNQAIEKGTYYKDVAIKKGKDYKITQYSEEQLKTIVSFMEKKVEQLNNNYLHYSVNTENVGEQNLVQRIVNLSQTINTLARFTIQDQLKNIQQMPLTQKSVAMYYQLLANPRVREAVIFTSITQEFLSDMIQTKLLAPSITYFDAKSQDLKNYTKITMENVQTKVIKQYIPLLVGKYATLKSSSVNFYENKMTVEFAKEYYQTNEALIQKEMKDLYSNFMKYQETVKQNYNSVYTSALDSYKKKRLEKLAIQEDNEKKSIEEVKSDDSQLIVKKNE